MMGVPQIERVEVGGGMSLKDVEVMISARQCYVGGTASLRWVMQADERRGEGGLFGRSRLRQQRCLEVALRPANLT
jgi:hypothetical protein